MFVPEVQSKIVAEFNLNYLFDIVKKASIEKKQPQTLSNHSSVNPISYNQLISSSFIKPTIV